MPQSTASLSGESKVASDRLEELLYAYLCRGHQIPGVEECLELLRELETKDPKAAKTLLDDAFSSVSTSEGLANSLISWFGALLGRPKDKPSTYPLPKEPEIDYSEAIVLVRTLKEEMQELKMRRSTLPDPAPQGLRSLTLLLAVRANSRRQVKNTNAGPRAGKDHVFKDRKMGQALLEVCPNLEEAQGLHYLEKVQDCSPPNPSVYCVNGRPLSAQFQSMDHLLSILILSEKFQYWAHSLAPPASELHKTTFPRARTWLLAVDEDMKEEFKAQMIQKIEDLCKTKIDFEEVGKVEVLPVPEFHQDPDV